MVAAVLRTLTALPEAPPPPRISRQSHASEGAGGGTSDAETRREMVSSASQILHAAPSHLLAPLAEELVDLALHAHEALHEDGRLLLQRLDEPPRQRAARKVVSVLGAAAGAAVASRVEAYAKLLEALHKGQPCMLHPHTEALVRLATGGLALGAEVASATLPALANDAAIFSQVVEQLQASGTEWQPAPVVRTLKLMGRLDPVALACHEHAGLLFERCLLHPHPTVSCPRYRTPTAPHRASARGKLGAERGPTLAHALPARRPCPLSLPAPCAGAPYLRGGATQQGELDRGATRAARAAAARGDAGPSDGPCPHRGPRAGPAAGPGASARQAQRGGTRAARGGAARRHGARGRAEGAARDDPAARVDPQPVLGRQLAR